MATQIDASNVHARFLTPNELDLGMVIPKTENVRVMVRFRPVNDREKREEKKFYSYNSHLKGQDPGIGFPYDNAITVPTFGRAGVFSEKKYTFDGVLDSSTSQMEAFETAARQTCDDILAGYNGTIFVYGQTGSGKTHTMYGPEICIEDLMQGQKSQNDNSKEKNDENENENEDDDESDEESDSKDNGKGKKQRARHMIGVQGDPEDMGIIPMSVGYIFNALNDESNEQFQNIKGYEVTASFFEIYNESFVDLIDPDSEPKMQFDTKKQMSVITGLSQEVVKDLPHMLKLIAFATKNRTTSATNMNATSSRSHMILRLTVTVVLQNGQSRQGVGNFADLAGSESQRKTNAKGQRFEEAKNINLSLSTLQRVIESLSKRKKHVPYKESKLTHVLQDSLGGNCKTTLLIAASPHIFNRPETINSLDFGKRCKLIKNKAIVNLHVTPKHLREQIESLQKELENLANSKMIEASEVVKADMKKQKDLNMQLQGRIEDFEQRFNDREEELADINVQKSKLEEELELKNEEINEMKETNNNLENEIKNMKEKIESTENEIKNLENQNEELTNENNKLKENESQLVKEKQTLLIEKERETREKEDNAEKIASLEDRIERLTNIQQAKEEEIVALSNEKDSATKETIANMQNKYKEMQDAMQSELDGLRDKLKKLNNSHFRVASAHKDLEFENKQLQNKDDVMQQEMGKLKAELEKYKSMYHESENENEKLKNELNNLKEELLSQQKRNTELENEWNDKYESLSVRYESTTHQLTREIVKLTKSKMNYQKELNKMKKEHQEALTSQQEEMTNMQTQLAFLKTVYDGVREKKRVAIGDTYIHGNTPHSEMDVHHSGQASHLSQFDAMSMKSGYNNHQSPRHSGHQSGHHSHSRPHSPGHSPGPSHVSHASRQSRSQHKRRLDNVSYSQHSQQSQHQPGVGSPASPYDTSEFQNGEQWETRSSRSHKSQNTMGGMGGPTPSGPNGVNGQIYHQPGQSQKMMYGPNQQEKYLVNKQQGPPRHHNTHSMSNSMSNSRSFSNTNGAGNVNTQRQMQTSIRVHSQSDAPLRTKLGTADPGGVKASSKINGTPHGDDDDDSRAKKKKYMMAAILILIIIIIILAAT